MYVTYIVRIGVGARRFYVLFVSCLFGVYPICHESRGREAPEGE